MRTIAKPLPNTSERNSKPRFSEAEIARNQVAPPAEEGATFKFTKYLGADTGGLPFGGYWRDQVCGNFSGKISKIMSKFNNRFVVYFCHPDSFLYKQPFQKG